MAVLHAAALSYKSSGTAAATGAAAAADAAVAVLCCCCQVRDPRVPASANDTFLDMLEGYFSRSEQEKQAEERPDLAYQVSAKK
jgi:hypothetical protein